MNLTIENCKNELKKLYKTIELNRATLLQYENVIKEQQEYIQQFRTRPGVLTERNGQKIDDLVINLDINISPSHDGTKRMLFY